MIPKVEFRTSKVEEIIDVLEWFIKGDWKERIFRVYPELKNKLENASNTDKNKIIYNFFKELEGKVNLDKKRQEFQKSWDKINKKIMRTLEDIVEIKWPEDCQKIIARVTLNPICPRYLQWRTFDVFYNFSNVRMREVTLHELLHFIYFEKWKEVFPKTPAREFDSPCLVWRLSEMVPAIILKDWRIQKVLKHEPRVYDEFYRIEIGKKPLLSCLQEIYDIENSGNYVTTCPEFSNGQFSKISNQINRIVHKKKDFADFLKKSYEFVKKHKGELKR